MSEIKETAWNHLSNTGQRETHGTFCSSERKWINKIEKLAEVYPDQVQIRTKNPDSSIVALIPISWFKVSPPRRREYTPEQLANAAARLAAGRAAKASAN